MIVLRRCENPLRGIECVDEALVPLVGVVAEDESGGVGGSSVSRRVGVLELAGVEPDGAAAAFDARRKREIRRSTPGLMVGGVHSGPSVSLMVVRVRSLSDSSSSVTGDVGPSVGDSADGVWGWLAAERSMRGGGSDTRGVRIAVLAEVMLDAYRDDSVLGPGPAPGVATPSSRSPSSS